MPRIDPHQLLSCLTVLLTPTGGILSENEVKRLANLMTKFSKKLVSKCVYVLILRNTDPPLLGSFMVEGGWNLVHVWLQDGYNNKNWALVSELLELLLMSPTTVEQLKTNNLPKLVKSLSKRDDLEKVKDLANQLVQKWLKIVKEDQNQNNQIAVERVQSQNVQVVSANSATVAHPIELVEVPVIQVEPDNVAIKSEPEACNVEEEVEDPTITSENAQACYKLALRDGKHILCKVSAGEANVTVVENAIIEDITPVQEAGEKSVEKNDNVDIKEDKELENKEPIELEKKKEKSNHDRQKAKHSRSSTKSSNSKSGKDKEKKSSSGSSRDKSKDKIRSSKSKERNDRDGSKEKEKSDKDKHRSNGSLKSGSSSSKSSSSSNKESSKDKDKTKKETKEKQAEKDKDTLNKIQPQILQKIGRIPKKNSEDGKEEKKEETKKPSFSIEVRKNSEEKPKTVKVFNAKMRSTGLLEEAKPPPPRPVKKTTTVLPSIPAKRPSPIRDLIPPPEKKVKIEPAERPGAIKLIPPKPKRVRCGEDDWEMSPVQSVYFMNETWS